MTDLIDDIANCEASPYNLDVDHYAVAVTTDLIVKESIRDVKQTTLADAYHALYANSVALMENPEPIAASWWQEFFRSGEAGKLRAKTVGNHKLAMAACADVARSVETYVRQEPPRPEGETASYESLRRRIQSVKVAAAAADEKADQAIAIAQTLHDGLGAGVDRAAIEDAERMIKRSATLQKILNIAGAMSRYRRGAKRRKTEGFDRVSTITQSGDLTKLLPTELMQLAGPPVLAANTMRRLVENQTLAMKKYSYEKAGRGPIVVIVDESGSMSGEPFEQAKGLALAMARVAKEQSRWICLVGFSSSGQVHSLVMPPDKWDLVQLFDWLTHFYCGGTDFHVLQRVMNNWERWRVPKGKADIIFCTDGEAWFPEDLVARFNKFKHDNEVKCYGMAIGTSLEDLPLVCDKSWLTHTMGLESNAVKEVLTI